jgi:predicted HTH transcriptional regulator
MTWDDLLACLRQPESTSLRFLKKDPDPDALGIAMVAMANAEGGTIIVGIDHKNLHFFGSLITDAKLKHLVKHHCRDQFNVTTNVIPRGDKCIVGIQVHESTQKPVFFRDACYLYMGEGSKFFIAQDPFAVLSLDSDIPTGPVSAVEYPAEVEIPAVAPVNVAKLAPDTVEITPKETKPSVQQSLFESLNERQRQALSFLKSTPTIRNQVYREMFGISHKTAHIELTDLVTRGILSQEGAGRSTHYVLPLSQES